MHLLSIGWIGRKDGSSKGDHEEEIRGKHLDEGKARRKLITQQTENAAVSGKVACANGKGSNISCLNSSYIFHQNSMKHGTEVIKPTIEISLPVD
jgi:hypothetical protein